MKIYNCKGTVIVNEKNGNGNTGARGFGENHPVRGDAVFFGRDKKARQS